MSSPNNNDYIISEKDLVNLRFSLGFRSFAYNPREDGNFQNYLNQEAQRKQDYINRQIQAHNNRVNNNGSNN
jgi:hypothetical protein